VDRDRLERLLDPAAVDDVTALPMEELRRRRAEGQELEVGVSYQRRIAQGRLDIVAAEQRRRASGEAPVDHDHLVQQLSGILADRTHAPGVGRLPQLLAPGPGELDTTELDAVAGPGLLSRLPELDDERLASLIEDLSAHEAELSARRHTLHERIDVLQAEITRRYKTGEASVESLLR
jgi:hypothetical protein